jgi:hypothetical protein
MDAESPDTAPEPAASASRRSSGVWLAALAGLAAVVGVVVWVVSADDELVPDQAELEAVLDTAVADLDLPERQLEGLESTCLKPIDECGPALVAGYDLADVDAVCAMVTEIGSRIEVAERDDEACWVAGTLDGHPFIVELGVSTPDTSGALLSLIVI